MLWSEMTEEEIKENVGKVLEEYPKKCTNSESVFNWKNEKQNMKEYCPNFDYKNTTFERIIK